MDQNLFEEPFLLLLFIDECFYYGSLITQTSLATVFEAGEIGPVTLLLDWENHIASQSNVQNWVFSSILCIEHDLRCETAYHIHLEILFQTL